MAKLCLCDDAHHGNMDTLLHRSVKIGNVSFLPCLRFFAHALGPQSEKSILESVCLLLAIH